MATLIDTDFLRENFDVSEDITDTRLQANIGAASRRLKAWVTDAVYQSKISSADPNDSKDDFKLAEANLALHYAVLGLNTPITSKGIIKSSRAKERDFITYLTPADISDIAALYLEQAEEIMRPYRDLPDGVTLGIITDDESVSAYGNC